MDYLYVQKNILLDYNLRSDPEGSLYSVELFDLFASSQHSMLVKHGFSQPIIAFISVEKSLIL